MARERLDAAQNAVVTRRHMGEFTAFSARDRICRFFEKLVCLPSVSVFWPSETISSCVPRV